MNRRTRPNGFISTTVLAKTFDLKVALIPIGGLQFDPKNPRLGEDLALRKGRGLTHKQIMDFFEGQKKSPLLVESIRNNGLARPLLVTPKDGKSKHTVRDGNRRFYAHLKLNDETGEFDQVLCLICPPSMTERHIQAYINLIQNVGEVGWSSYSKAAHMVNQVRDHGIKIDEVPLLFDIAAADYPYYESTYDACTTYMQETGEADPRWSQWYEAIKRSPNKVLRALDDNTKRKLIHECFQQNRFKARLSSRKLSDMCGSAAALRRCAKHGVDEGLKQVAKNKKPASGVFENLDRLKKSLKKFNGSLVTRLQSQDPADVDLMCTVVYELVEVLRSTDNGSDVQAMLEGLDD